MTSLKELREKRGQLHKQFQDIVNRAEAERRDLTREEDLALHENEKQDLGLVTEIRRIELEDKGKDLSRPIGLQGGSGIFSSGGSGSGNSPSSETGFRFVDNHGVEHRALGPQDSFVRREDSEEFGSSSVNIGRMIRAAATGRSDLVSEKYRNAMTGSGNGGILLSPWVGGQLVDLARSRAVCLAAGAQTIRMDTREMTIVRLLSDPVPQWRGEGKSIAASSLTVGAYKLDAKTLAVRVPLTAELLEDSANADQLIINAISGAMGLAVVPCQLEKNEWHHFPNIAIVGRFNGRKGETVKRSTPAR